MLDKIFGLILLVSGIWIFAFVLCTFHWVQRHVFYAHKLPIWWRQKLDCPESFGFLPNQVSQQTVTTPDNVKLFSWLVIPLRAYLDNEKALVQPLNKDEAAKSALNLITSDLQAKLVIYFHGNASAVGSTRRTEAYRSISAYDSQHIYVLAFDYRGFGRSTGFPTESGMKSDAISVIEWAHQNCQVPYDRILLLSQSLGTAIASAALEHYATKNPPVDFAGLVLCAPFTDVASIFMSYAPIGGVPVLHPLKRLGALRRYFVRNLGDQWLTTKRLEVILTRYSRFRLTFIHCTKDNVVPYHMTESLSAMATELLRDYGSLEVSKLEFAGAGSMVQCTSAGRVVRTITTQYGGHNTIMKWAPTAFEVAKMFEATADAT